MSNIKNIIGTVYMTWYSFSMCNGGTRTLIDIASGRFYQNLVKIFRKLYINSILKSVKYVEIW